MNNKNYIFSQKGTYDGSYICSFGCMCSCANYLKKKGFRFFSSIFDWCDSTLEGNIRLVKNNFSDLLNKQYLEQNYPDYKHIVTNKLYNLSFVHLFDKYSTYDRQIQKVKDKAKHLINNFLFALNSKRCILVYYIRKESEVEWVKNNIDIVESFCKDYSTKFIFVSNYDFTLINFPVFCIARNNIHQPFGGDVSFPFEDTENLDKYLENYMQKSYIQRNLKFINKKHPIKKIISNIKFKLKNKTEKLILN